MAESPITQQFDIPGKEPSGVLGSGFGPTIGAGERSSIRVVVRQDGTTEFWSVTPGKDPERVVPTAQELAYAKEIVGAQKAAAPDTTPKTVTAADGSTWQYDPTNTDPDVTKRWKMVTPAKVEKPPEKVTETGPGGVQRQVTPAQADQDYREAQELSRQKQLTKEELNQAALQKHQQLQTMVALGQLEQRESDARMERWKQGIEAGQSERRLAIEQQNANTTAGQLGVSRGTLGVSQQNADTNREQVIQSAADNAVKNTIDLMKQYTKVGPGFGSQFAAGLNTLSKGGGAINFTPDAFMNPYVPDLDAIRTSAVTDAINRLKGGTTMAPATAAAVNQTSVPGAVAPAAVPPQPAQQPGQFTAGAIGAAGQAAGILPGAPPAPPPVVPPYTGPLGTVATPSAY